jgi:predicted AAA+ superfamily ATPase
LNGVHFLHPHRNQSLSHAAEEATKIYFYDTGLVVGDDGLRFENLVATALHKHVQWQHDVQGQEAGLHYIRTKDGAEVDFALSHKGQLSQLVECKLSDPKPHRALLRFAREQPQAQAVQVVRHLPHSHVLGEIQVLRADEYLNGLVA